MNQNKEATKKENNNGWARYGGSAFYTSIWFGAIIRYTFFLGQKKFEIFYNEKNVTKNAIVGWLFKMILIFGSIYLLLLNLETT